MSVWTTIGNTIREEFSDLPDAAMATRITVRLVVAAVLAGILGYEREKKGKAAGIRTHMLVAIGAALFVLVPQQSGATAGDISRILQGLVAGVGFLGAGSILKGKGDGDGANDDSEIKGLTTAASIWLTAAIGMAAGLGREATAALSTLLALVVLTLIPKAAGWVGNRF
jgi:putative Mg2+ transporter-C (MgtC) family protein